MNKIDEYDAMGVCDLRMPKSMQNRFWERHNSGQYANVDVKGMKGKAMKSENCTVIVFPDNNCSSQFKDIVNKLR